MSQPFMAHWVSFPMCLQTAIFTWAISVSNSKEPNFIPTISFQAFSSYCIAVFSPSVAPHILLERGIHITVHLLCACPVSRVSWPAWHQNILCVFYPCWIKSGMQVMAAESYPFSSWVQLWTGDCTVIPQSLLIVLGFSACTLSFPPVQPSCFL